MEIEDNIATTAKELRVELNDLKYSMGDPRIKRKVLMSTKGKPEDSYFYHILFYFSGFSNVSAATEQLLKIKTLNEVLALIDPIRLTQLTTNLISLLDQVAKINSTKVASVSLSLTLLHNVILDDSHMKGLVDIYKGSMEQVDVGLLKVFMIRYLILLIIHGSCDLMKVYQLNQEDLCKYLSGISKTIYATIFTKELANALLGREVFRYLTPMERRNLCYYLSLIKSNVTVASVLNDIQSSDFGFHYYIFCFSRYLNTDYKDRGLVNNFNFCSGMVFEPRWTKFSPLMDKEELFRLLLLTELCGYKKNFLERLVTDQNVVSKIQQNADLSYYFNYKVLERYRYREDDMTTSFILNKKSFLEIVDKNGLTISNMVILEQFLKKPEENEKLFKEIMKRHIEQVEVKYMDPNPTLSGEDVIKMVWILHHFSIFPCSRLSLPEMYIENVDSKLNLNLNLSALVFVYNYIGLTGDSVNMLEFYNRINLDVVNLIQGLTKNVMLLVENYSTIYSFINFYMKVIEQHYYRRRNNDILPYCVNCKGRLRIQNKTDFNKIYLCNYCFREHLYISHIKLDNPLKLDLTTFAIGGLFYCLLNLDVGSWRRFKKYKYKLIAMIIEQLLEIVQGTYSIPENDCNYIYHVVQVVLSQIKDIKDKEDTYGKRFLSLDNRYRAIRDLYEYENPKKVEP
jgi:hypothetical protein